MPLNNATYDSGRDVIFAVRGGYIYKLNATTGSVITAARFNFPPWGDATYVALATNVDKLYAGVWHDPQPNVTAGVFPRQGICKINPDTFALENFVDTANIENDFGSGPFSLEFSSPYVYFVYKNDLGHSISLYRYDPTTDTIGANTSVDGPTTDLESQLAVKTSDASISIVRRDRVSNYTAAVVLNFSTANFSGTGEVGRGVAHDLVNDNYYVACETQNVLKIPASTGAAAAIIDTLQTNARPRRARWNSVDGKVYIPSWQDNSIIVINPAAADAVSVQTGFDSPYDMVFTPTKKWAVQHGRVGLKEVA